MSCTAGLCVCGVCGTSGRGDFLAALERAKERAVLEQLRQSKPKP